MTAYELRISDWSSDVCSSDLHWQTQGVRVGATAMPETIHDFSGFPAPLYELQYTPPGAPALAAQIVRMLVDAGFLATIDARRGLDHGALVPLRYLKPDAAVPVLQVSLPHDLDEARSDKQPPELQ